MEVQVLKPISSIAPTKLATHLANPIKRIVPLLYCENRSFDFLLSRFLISASIEGYLILFSNDSKTLLAIDVFTDDWCGMDTSGFERYADDSPLEGVCVCSRLFLIGQSSTDEKSTKRKKSTNNGGCEIKVQCFEFATKKWTKVGTFNAPTNAELIVAGVVKKYGSLAQSMTASAKDTKISIFVLCANGQLIEASIDPLNVILRILRRSTINNAAPLLNTLGATIDECANLKSNEWKFLERHAFFDSISNRLFWLGVSNCAYDSLHILDLSMSRNDRQWKSIRVPRNDRRDLRFLESSPHSSRIVYLSIYQRILFFLSESLDQPSNSTLVYSVTIPEIDGGWKLIDTLSNFDITNVCAGDFGDFYCLNRKTSKDKLHQEQQISKFYFGVPSLKYLTIKAAVNALDPKTKRIQKRYLSEQLGKNVSSDLVDAFWYRTKLDRGVLRYLSKGMGTHGEYAKDDDRITFWSKLISRVGRS